MKQVYTYYNRSHSIYYILGYMFMIGLIFFLLRMSASYLPPLIVSLPVLYFLLTRIHRTFFVKITFADDKVNYKSLFRNIDFFYKDIPTVLLLTKPYIRLQRLYLEVFKRYDYDYELFEDAEEINEFPIGATFVLIGEVNYYSINPFFTMMRAVNQTNHNYITLEYRKELWETMNYVLSQKNVSDAESGI